MYLSQLYDYNHSRNNRYVIRLSLNELDIALGWSRLRKVFKHKMKTIMIVLICTIDEQVH